MDGEVDGKERGLQEANHQATQAEPQQQAQAESLTAGGADATGAGTNYEALLAERDAKIAELEGAIAEAVKSAEAAEALRAEMDELRRQGEEQRVEFELTMAGARNARAARVLLDEHGGDVSKLKDAAPWLFEGAASRQGGKIGLPNAGAAFDEGKTMKRWREIADIADKEQQMGNSIASVKNCTTIPDEVYQCTAVSACLNSPRRTARGAQRQGDYGPEDRGDGPRRLHPQRRLQDGVDRLRVRDQDVQLRPGHQAAGG